jgi:hypothetical protein
MLAIIKGKKMKHEANSLMFDSKDNMEISIIKYHDQMIILNIFATKQPLRASRDLFVETTRR